MKNRLSTVSKIMIPGETLLRTLAHTARLYMRQSRTQTDIVVHTNVENILSAISFLMKTKVIIF